MSPQEPKETMAMGLGLKGRACNVTGGIRGLGRLPPASGWQKGSRAVVSGRSEKLVAADAEALGGAERVLGVVADNADAGTPDRLVEAAHCASQRLDGVLISVGGPPTGTSDVISGGQ
ncbi:hypothetical protein [Streptomyces sp. NPDC001970]